MKANRTLSRGVYITTNQTCNLDCLYCYEHNKTNTDTFDIKRTQKTLISVLSQKTDRGTLISFHGGEPFLCFSKIRELCEWAWNQNFPERFLFFTTTNGTLVKGEIQKWLYYNRHRFIVSISLDGTRDMHNLNRSNSFDSIDFNFFVQTWPTQGVKMTISPQTIGKLADGVIFINSIGFNDIRANLAEMVDWSSPSYLGVYQRELRKLSNYYLSHPDIERCSLFNINFPALLHKEPRKWCGVGTEMEAIDVDGRVYPCHLFFESVCGKKKSEDSLSIDFSDPQQYISDICHDCKFLKICPTCYGSNYIARDNISSRDISMCSLHKVRFSEVAKFEYDRIVNDKTDIQMLTDSEKHKRMRILEAIESIASELK